MKEKIGLMMNWIGFIKKRNVVFGASKSVSGFTLVEMAVITSVIAILMLLMIVGGLNYVKRAHNAKRKSDMVKFKAGMESFYAQNKFYPNPGENKSDGSGIIEGDGFPKCSVGNDVIIAGFTKVNKCLSYLGYVEILNAELTDDDPNYRYRYAVLDDMMRWEASVKMEISGEKDLTKDCVNGASPNDKCDDSRYEIGPAVDKVDTSSDHYCFTADGTVCVPSGATYISTTD